MAEKFLRDLDVAGGFQHALRERVTEKMRMNRDASPSTDVAQGRLTTRIAKGLALTLPRSDPNGVNVLCSTALCAQILFVNRPEFVGNRHAVLGPRTRQPHGDQAPLAIDCL